MKAKIGGGQSSSRTTEGTRAHTSANGGGGTGAAAIAELDDPAFIAWANACAPALKNKRDLRVAESTTPPTASYSAQRKREIIDAYDSKCLQPFSTLGSRQEAVRARLGSLYRFGAAAPYICSATRISRRVALTARHCVFDDKEPADRIEDRDLYFSPASAPTTRVAVRTVEHPSTIKDVTRLDRSRHDLDYVFIIVDDAALPPLPLVKFGRLTPYARLMIVGVQADLQFPERLSAAGDWLAFVRHDDRATCRVFAEPATGCFLHGCQTAAGVSGAAVFRATGSGSELEFVGVHTSGLTRASARCTDPAFVGNANVALSISSQLNADLQQVVARYR